MTEAGGRATPKALVKKDNLLTVAKADRWVIVEGDLVPVEAAPKRPGRKRAPTSLFRVVAEKIPFQFLSQVQKSMRKASLPAMGVYIAHDSMGYPRYVGRGNIFTRLTARKKAQVLELAYFSFFVVVDKKHERKIETIMIRAAGPILDFNSRKVRTDIQAGDVRDFDAGTHYYERQYQRGKTAKNGKDSASVAA